MKMFKVYGEKILELLHIHECFNITFALQMAKSGKVFF
jgi:hypothetical protein